MGGFIPFIIGGVVLAVVFSHDVPAAANGFCNSETQSLIEGHRTFVFDKHIQHHRFPHGIAAVSDHTGADTPVPEGRQHIEIIDLVQAVFVPVEMIVSRFFAIGTDDCVLPDLLFDLAAHPVHHKRQIDLIQLLIILYQFCAQLINWRDVGSSCRLIGDVHVIPA